MRVFTGDFRTIEMLSLDEGMVIRRLIYTTNEAAFAGAVIGNYRLRKITGGRGFFPVISGHANHDGLPVGQTPRGEWSGAQMVSGTRSVLLGRADHRSAGVDVRHDGPEFDEPGSGAVAE